MPNPNKNELIELLDDHSRKQIANKYEVSVRTVARLLAGHRLFYSRPKKLTFEDATKIRELYLTDRYTQKELGEMFGVTQALIGRILNNLIHKAPNVTVAGAAATKVRLRWH